LSLRVELAIRDRHANAYDSLARRLPHRRDLVRSVCDYVDGKGLDGSLRVLELGCATGDLSLELVRRGHWVVGLDPDGAMTRFAQRGAGQVLNADFRQHDLAGPLPLGDREFDVVVCSTGLLAALAEPGGLLYEAERVLADGGALLMLTPAKSAAALGAPEQRRPARAAQTALATGTAWLEVRSLEAALSLVAAPGGLAHLDRSRLSTVLGGAGFDVEIVTSGVTRIATAPGFLEDGAVA
jgi:SAM-dependent methyltransferase